MSTGGNIANNMGLARTALLAGNNAEALTYFNRVLEADPTMSEAWIGKGKAAAWQSTLLNIRTPEAIIAFNHAIATAPDEHKATVTAEAIEETNKIVVALYGMARRHLEEFVAVEGTWVQYLGQVSQLLDALDQVRIWDPTNGVTLENIVHLCKDNIEGISYRDFDGTPNSWHLSPEYESMIKARLDSAVNDLRTLDPSYAPPSIEKKRAEACFVVTVTMGDPGHPTVKLMRAFRDQCITRSRLGRWLIQQYYCYGPLAAKYIGQNRLRRRVAYALIVAPAAVVAKLLLRRRPSNRMR